MFPKISETFILTHVAALIEAGHQVTVFATDYRESEDIHPIFSEYNMKAKTVYKIDVRNPIKRIALIPFLFLKNIKHHRALIKSFSPKYYGSYALKGYFFYDVLSFIHPAKFDIIHCHFGPNASKVAMIRQLGILQGKLICTFHGHDINDQREIQGQYNYKYLMPDLSAAICVVDYIKFKLVSLFAPKYKVYKNPVSVNINQFKLKQFSSEHSPLSFISVGRVIDWKGQLETVKAFKNISTQYPQLDFQYTIIGEGPDLDEIREFIAINKLGHKIHTIGSKPQGEVVSQLQKSDVLILFGRKDKYQNIDAQGTVVQEAQATGTPVIVSDAGGLPEGMINYVTGLVVPENNTDELENAILNFYNNRDQIKTMGLAGRKFVEENYANEVVYKRLFEIYNQMIENN
ncbi:glycosyltransferase [Saccharicrinis fermentans]|uniref:glycosyltransferase n=1 Tax=Saccharicrinis fermentans TaxID=982 RepID=UPI00138B158C|nr:glycosyltransferase [Saccharicrinis fermentans]